MTGGVTIWHLAVVETRPPTGVFFRQPERLCQTQNVPQRVNSKLINKKGKQQFLKYVSEEEEEEEEEDVKGIKGVKDVKDVKGDLFFNARDDSLLAVLYENLMSC